MSDRVGQQFGNYQLVRLLGEGGFAEVYLGEHLHLSSLVAIKLLRTRLITREQEEFLQEARTIAALEHPSIVRVLDCGIEHGEPFLIMQYAPNGTVRQRYPHGSRLPSTEIISYTSQVAAALQYAHEQKLIHRDVKPENLLLGSEDELLLSDFGIALISSSSSSQSTKAAAGTVSYMAPEQVMGKPRIASDQYALGVVVYEWLCGELPFHGSFSEMCAQHLYAPPPALIEKNPEIPPAVEQVVLRALAKDPAARFACVQDFAMALEGAYQRVPVTLSDGTTLEPGQATASTELVAEDDEELIPTHLVAEREAGVPAEAEAAAVVAEPDPDALVPTSEGISVVRTVLEMSEPEPVATTQPGGNASGVSRTEPDATRAAAMREEAAEPTEPMPTIASGPSRPRVVSYLPLKPQRNALLVAGAVLLLLLILFPLMLHYDLVLTPRQGETTGNTKNTGHAGMTLASSVTNTHITPTPTLPPTPTPRPTPTPVPANTTSNNDNQQPVTQQPATQQDPAQQQPVQQQPATQQDPAQQQPAQQQPPQPQERQLTSDVDLGIQVSSTGQAQTAATRASGQVTIYPVPDLTQSVYQALGGSNPSAGINLITDPLWVPAANGTPVTVNAIATYTGSVGNFPMGAIFGCGGSCYGYITGGFNNGQDAQSYAVVQQADIDNAAQQLIATSVAQGRQDIQSQLNANESLEATPQCTYNWQSDHSAGDAVQTFNVAIVTHCTATATT